MQAKHMWRDVFSVDAWRTILANTRMDIADLKGTTVPSSGFQTQALTLKLKSYHDIPKRDLKKFADRRKALAEIAEIASKIARPAQPVVKAGSKMVITRGDYTDTFAETSLYPWLDSLQRRCAKKGHYLAIMASHYSDKTIDRTPEAFLKHLKTSLKTHDKARLKGGALPMQPGVAMERADPYHRPIELGVTLENGKVALKGGTVFPLTDVLREWLADASARRLPFYVWLEDHPICTTTPGLDPDFKKNYKSYVRSIPYGPGSTPFLSVFSEGGGLRCRRIDDEDDTPQLFDTTNSTLIGGISIKQPGTAAYVWIKDRGIFSFRHAPGELHHSTLGGGEAVHCAGMWKVQRGWVTLVNNNSGHYKPSRAQVERFREHLEQLRVISKDALFQAHDGHKFVAI